MIGYFRDAVGIGQAARPQPGQDLFEPVRLEADQVELETAEFEILQLTAQQIGVPAPARGQFIVGQAIGLLFILAPAAYDAHWNGFELQPRCGGHPQMPGDQYTVLVHEDRVRPPPFEDRCGYLVDVGFAEKPRISAVRCQPFERLKTRPARPARVSRGWAPWARMLSMP